MLRPKGPPPTLPVRAEDFLRDSCQPLSKTEAAYRSALVNFQRFAEATQLTQATTSLTPQALRTETLADYYSWLKQHHYRNASIRLYLSAINQYCTWLEASQCLPAPLHLAEMQAVLNKKSQHGRRTRPERRGSDVAVGALLGYYAKLLAEPYDAEKAKPRARCQHLIALRNHAILQTLYATAGRASEIAALQRADVAEGRATQFEIVGKGGKRRLLFLTQPAQQAIQSYLRERTDTATALFVSHSGGKEQPLPAITLWAIVNDTAKAVFGVDKTGRPKKRVGPHAFRHLRAQDLSNAGMSLTSLQTLLGHESIETTRSTYAPKTLPEKVLDELITYGQAPEIIVKRGEQALQRP